LASRAADPIRRDYANTEAMVFGRAPDFDAILASVATLEATANQAEAKT
jgi:hypothetical protein